MIKTFVAIILLITVLSLNAQTTYYPSKFQDLLRDSSVNSDILKRAISEVLWKGHQKQENGQNDILVSRCGQDTPNCYQHQVLGYKLARKYLFGALHLKQNENGYYITDVYCEKVFNNHTIPGNTIGPMSIPPDKYINCEHTWPQSKFNSHLDIEMQKSDLHHLYPSDNQANGLRSNFPFAEVSGHETSLPYCNQSILGYLASGKAAPLYFEPIPSHRGNVARAIFYFSIRYNLPVQTAEENSLRKWHQEDPVDEEEMLRNNAIMQVQGSRNPFIDYPEMVEMINDF